MFGWVIGTVAVVGLCAFARRRHHRHFAYYGRFERHMHGAWDEPSLGFHGSGRMRRRGSPRGMLRALFMRLDTTPGQEKALVRLFAEARERFENFKGDLGSTRRELAVLMGSEVLDKTALDAFVGRRRDTLDGLAQEVVRTLSGVHEVLDGEQRRELGELLANGSLRHTLRPRYGYC